MSAYARKGRLSNVHLLQDIYQARTILETHLNSSTASPPITHVEFLWELTSQPSLPF